MNKEENYISSLLSEAQEKYNQKEFDEALNILSLFLTKNYKILSFRAKIYYYQSEYYKSLKDCEECINLAINDKNNSNSNNYIEIYQLAVLNHIKMFDLESAKEKLKQCQKINKDNPKNSELLLLIKEEEKKNAENIKKYKQYPIYLQFIRSFYKIGLFLNKIEINFKSDRDRFCRATEDIYDKDILIRVPLEALMTLDEARKSQLGRYFTPELEKKLNSPHHSLLSTFMLTEIDKGLKSKWKYYFDFLPADYNNFPIFYSEKELAYLKGTQFLELVQKKRKK